MDNNNTLACDVVKALEKPEKHSASLYHSNASLVLSQLQACIHICNSIDTRQVWIHFLSPVYTAQTNPDSTRVKTNPG